MRVQLYTLIPAAFQDRPIARTGRAKLRNRLARVRDFALWKAARLWRGHYSTHEDAENSNRGDVAVRLGVRQQLLRALTSANVVIEEIPWGALDPTSDPDLLVLCGGGFFFPDATGRLPARFADELAAVERFRCPVIGASLGLNADLSRPSAPCIHPSQRQLIRRFVQALSLFSVRDRVTQSAFRPYTHAPDLVADPALFLQTPRPPEIVPWHPPWRATSGRPLSVGINLAFHGNEVSSLQSRTLMTVVRALRGLAECHRCSFSYFVHSSGERALARALQLAGIPCTLISGSVAELQAHYARLDLHIAQMLHSAILAVGQGTPVLGLAYDVKSYGFFEMMAQPSLCLNMWTVRSTDVLDAVLWMIATQGDLRAAIRKRTLQLHAESDEFYEGISMLAVPGRSTSARVGAS